MKKLITTLFILMLILTLSACKTNESNTILVGISPDYPPYESLTVDGEMVGFDIDMTNLFSKYLKEEGYDYVRGIVIDENTNNIDGYVVVSKHDLYDNYKDMRYATKEKRVTFGTQLCKKSLTEYNNILNGNIFKIIITDTNKNEILCNKIVSGKLLVEELVNFEDDKLQEIINKMINIADLEERKEVDNVQEII